MLTHPETLLSETLVDPEKGGHQVPLSADQFLYWVLLEAQATVLRIPNQEIKHKGANNYSPGPQQSPVTPTNIINTNLDISPTRKGAI